MNKFLIFSCLIGYFVFSIFLIFSVWRKRGVPPAWCNPPPRTRKYFFLVIQKLIVAFRSIRTCDFVVRFHNVLLITRCTFFIHQDIIFLNFLVLFMNCRVLFRPSFFLLLWCNRNYFGWLRVASDSSRV